MTAPPQAPVPDDKDWTWTLARPCPECGFDAAAGQHADVAHLVLVYTAPLVDALASPGATVRPQPAVWSALEYACHVRDVCRVFQHRLSLMLSQDDPVFENWDQDETALKDRYWQQRPEQVAPELSEAGASIAAAFGAVRADEWQRPGRRSNGSVFTVETFARYFLHDLAHHAHDVRSARDLGNFDATQ